MTITQLYVVIFVWGNPSPISWFIRFSLPRIAALSSVRRRCATSKRLKEKGVHGFAWQNGYGAFPVSESNAEAVIAYITNQAEHHRKYSFQEEVRELLKRHRITFYERYVWA